jgi:serine/threonine protein kinase
VRGTATELQDGMRLRLAIDVEYRTTPFAGTRLRHRALRADDVRRFASALGAQLAALHAQGLVHGAITPDQVLVDHAGHPWLLVHRPARAGASAADADPEHQAPELRAGGPLTAAADVYALGTLLVPALRDTATDLGLVAFVGQLMQHDPSARPAAWTLR